MRVFEFKSAGDWLMDAVNAILETNTVNLRTENMKIKM